MTNEPQSATEAPVADLAVIAATVLLHRDDGSIFFADDQTILIRDGAIVAVEPTTAIAPPSRETIDAGRMVVMPGLINGHTHSPMVMFRGVAEDVSGQSWFNDYLWPMEMNVTEDDIAVGARLAAAEMIAGGVTTFADQYFSMDVIAGVVAEAGMRASLAQTYFSTDGDPGLERSLEFALGWDGAAGGRITTALGPHANYTVSDEHLAKTAAAAIEHDIPIHTHASENRSQTKNARERLGYTPIEVLRRTGVLDAKLMLAHGCGIVPEDLPTLAAHAATVGVASSPRGYLKWAHETTPIRALDAIGVAVGVGTDGAASANVLDVWENMTLMALTQKTAEQDETYMTALDVLGHATLKSARAVHLAGTIGRIAPGYRADLILVDLATPRTQPIHDLASTLVFSARSSDVHTTIIDGTVVMRDRRILTLDVDAVIADMAPRLPRLTRIDGSSRKQEYRA